MGSSYCCSTYRVADPPSTLGTFSSSSIGGPVIHLIADCEHPLMCLLGPGIASQETDISETAAPGDPSHNQPPITDTIAYTSKILLKGP